MHKSFIARALAGCALALTSLCAFGQASAVAEFDIPKQPLETALRKVAETQNLQIIFTPRDVKGVETSGVKGKLTAVEAVDKLLEGTGLVAVQGGNNAIAVKPKAEERKPGVQGGASTSGPTILAQGPGAAGREPSSGTDREDARKRESSATIVETITVTGTNIRGSGNPTSSIQVYTRHDVERSGAATPQQFIQKLPQNFSGGASEHTIATVTGGASANQGIGGAGVNLRGLGNDSTLVLLNGHRLSPANRLGNFVDVSMLPLTAIERIEVLPDGASAIYGSDAVAGVVNFITRRDLDGAEIMARYGSVTRGSSYEARVAQTFGRTWDNGSAIAVFEYLKQTPLLAKDRALTSSALEPFTLTPNQERASVLLVGDHRLTNNFELFGDATYSRRSTYQDATWTGLSQHLPAKIENVTATGGGRIDVMSDVVFETSANYSLSTTQGKVFNRLTSTLQTAEDYDTSVGSIDAKLNGTLFQWTSGVVRVAAGGQYRKETFDYELTAASSRSFRTSRDVVAGFLELNIPVITSSRREQGPNLELNLAARAERYSDFGRTTNPKVGLAWRPADGVKVRTSFGTSFKAPLLNDTNPTPTTAAALSLPDSTPSGRTNALILFGGNPDLKPEKAKTWSLGLDALGKSMPVRVTVNYYLIRYEDRIAVPSASLPLETLLRAESLLGSSIIQRNPTLAMVNSAIASAARFTNSGRIDLSTIGVIVDNRSQNLSVVNTSGIDFGLSLRQPLGTGNFEIAVDGTKILKFKNRFTSSAPAVDILDTPYNPVNLKLRARGIYEAGPLITSLFMNYVDSYKDKRVAGVERKIGSWTTVDANLTYRTRRGRLGETALSVGINNLTDRQPPFVDNPFAFPSLTGINFDGANANILGRFVYVQVSKSW